MPQAFGPPDCVTSFVVFFFSARPCAKRQTRVSSSCNSHKRFAVSEQVGEILGDYGDIVLLAFLVDLLRHHGVAGQSTDGLHKQEHCLLLICWKPRQLPLSTVVVVGIAAAVAAAAVVAIDIVAEDEDPFVMGTGERGVPLHGQSGPTPPKHKNCRESCRYLFSEGGDPRHLTPREGLLVAEVIVVFVETVIHLAAIVSVKGSRIVVFLSVFVLACSRPILQLVCGMCVRSVGGACVA